MHGATHLVGFVGNNSLHFCLTDISFLWPCPKWLFSGYNFQFCHLCTLGNSCCRKQKPPNLDMTLAGVHDVFIMDIIVQWKPLGCITKSMFDWFDMKHTHLPWEVWSGMYVAILSTGSQGKWCQATYDILSSIYTWSISKSELLSPVVFSPLPRLQSICLRRVQE